MASSSVTLGVLGFFVGLAGRFRNLPYLAPRAAPQARSGLAAAGTLGKRQLRLVSPLFAADQAAEPSVPLAPRVRGICRDPAPGPRARREPPGGVSAR